jgi:transposase
VRHYVGLDISLHSTSVCIVDEKGTVLREAQVDTDPKTIVKYLKAQSMRYHRIGLESMALAAWVCAGLARAGLPVICIEARHASKVLKANLNKTDRNDARGIADLMRVSIYRVVHIKTPEAQHGRALLTARKLLLIKLVDLESGISGILRAFGIKVGRAGKGKYETNIRSLAAKEKGLRALLDPLLRARAALRQEFERLELEVLKRVDADPICQRLQTAPGVGPITALTYRCVIDQPARFARSRTVGAHLGLTPKTRQSGEMDRRGRISRCGDRALRSALVTAAMVLLRPNTRRSSLQAWGWQLAQRVGKMKAIIAVARRLSIVLHRMWVDGVDFQRDGPVAQTPIRTGQLSAQSMHPPNLATLNDCADESARVAPSVDNSLVRSM